MSDIVPFGKHKGKPVDALLDDREYVEWLTQQGWFREKYGNIYQVVINNGAEPSETPEHNAMQIRFLEREYRAKFVMAAIGREEFMKIVQAGKKDHASIISFLADCMKSYNEVKPIVDAYDGWYNKQISKPGLRSDKYRIYRFTQPDFEADGIDVDFYWTRGLSCDDVCLYSFNKEEFYDSNKGRRVARPDNRDLPMIYHSASISAAASSRYRIEIKPSVGDDYPAILRQMKRSGAEYLLIGNYTGIGATRQQVTDFFATSKITTVYANDVEQQELPEDFDTEALIIPR